MKKAWFAILLLCSAAWAQPGVSESSKVLYLGPGFLVGGGATYPGIGVSGAWKFESLPFYVGFESGGFFVRNPVNLLVPLAVSATYRFATESDIVPTLGLSLGGRLALGTGLRVLDFLFFVHPGFTFYLDEDLDLFFRTSLGLMGSTFEFYPQVGVAFAL